MSTKDDQKKTNLLQQLRFRASMCANVKQEVICAQSFFENVGSDEGVCPNITLSPKRIVYYVYFGQGISLFLGTRNVCNLSIWFFAQYYFAPKTYGIVEQPYLQALKSRSTLVRSMRNRLHAKTVGEKYLPICSVYAHCVYAYKCNFLTLYLSVFIVLTV